MSRNHARLDRRRAAAARWIVLNRDGWRCQEKGCGRAGRLEVHHRVSLEAGGEPYALGNLTTRCRPCHFKLTAAERIAKLPPDVQAWRNRLNSPTS